MRLVLILLATCLWLTPPSWAQPVTSAEQDRITRELIDLYKRDPKNPIFYQSEKTVQNAQGNGAGIQARGETAANIKDFNATAPNAGLGNNGPSASGGSTSAEVSALTEKAKNPWFWIGIVFIGLGLYFDLWYIDRTKPPGPDGKPVRGNKRDAAICFIVGASCLLIAFVPTIIWWCLGIAGAAVVAGYLYLSVTNPIAAMALRAEANKFKEAARAAVSAIESAPPEAAAAVKQTLHGAPDVTADDRAALLAIKHADFPEKSTL